MKTILALAQIEIILADVNANLEQARPMVQAAASRGASVILFPELWTTGYDLPRRSELALQNQPVLEEIIQLAAANRIIIGGSWLTSRGEHFYNTFHLVAPDGNVICYDKTHLFGLMDEDQWLSPGEKLAAAPLEWGSAGLAVCYDLRFPEIFRSYALQGVSALFIVAEWPARRLSHWQTLLRARAIENQVVVAAVNSTGLTAGVKYGGASCIISPWGEVLAEGGSLPGLVTAEVDLDEATAVRSKMTVLQDRRPDLYAQ